jgi:hypothetical protein
METSRSGGAETSRGGDMAVRVILKRFLWTIGMVSNHNGVFSLRLRQAFIFALRWAVHDLRMVFHDSSTFRRALHYLVCTAYCARTKRSFSVMNIETANCLKFVSVAFAPQLR